MKANSSEIFSRVQAELKANGYREKDVTFSSGKATVFGVLYALPFITILGLAYRFLLLERAHLLETGVLSFYIMFICSL